MESEVDRITSLIKDKVILITGGELTFSIFVAFIACICINSFVIYDECDIDTNILWFCVIGTGLIGKVLWEKLLRMTEVGKIYLLIRRRKGKAPQERLVEMLNNPVSFCFNIKCTFWHWS